MMTDYQKGVRAAFAIIAVLCGLCMLASLSGCLTAAKIGEWREDSGGPVSGGMRDGY